MTNDWVLVELSELEEEEATLVCARVVDSRVSPRNFHLVIEYKIEIETLTHGAFAIWYPYKTFYHLSETLQKRSAYASSGIPTLPKEEIPLCATATMHKGQVCALDRFLTAAVKADRMRWAIRINKSLCAVKHKLSKGKWEEATLISARVVASRVVERRSRSVVEYKVEVETLTHGAFAMWHRYKTFCHLSEALKVKRAYASSGIPELPKSQPEPQPTVQMCVDRVATLDRFITAAVKADSLAWGIRINDNLCAIKKKRRVPTLVAATETEVALSRDSLASNATTLSCWSEQSTPRASSA